MASGLPFLSLLAPQFDGQGQLHGTGSSSALLTWDKALDEHCLNLADPNPWNFGLSVYVPGWQRCAW